MSAARKARRSRGRAMTSKAKDLFSRRGRRVRARIAKRSNERLRISVFRSSKPLYAQVIADASGRPVGAAWSIDKSLRESLKKSADKAAAAAVGKLVAERAKAAGVTAVVFDRGGYLFHGRVKAL